MVFLPLKDLTSPLQTTKWAQTQLLGNEARSWWRDSVDRKTPEPEHKGDSISMFVLLFHLLICYYDVFKACWDVDSPFPWFVPSKPSKCESSFYPGRVKDRSIFCQHKSHPEIPQWFLTANTPLQWSHIPTQTDKRQTTVFRMLQLLCTG